jgi:hypothetical protein
LCNVYPKDQDETSNKEKLHKKKQQFINRTNFLGFTALHLAAQNGHNQSVRELLYAGCSTSIQTDYGGDFALHTAIRYGHAGVLRILISAKCDIDAFNLNHDTPLHIAAAIGRRKLTKLLVEAGAMQFRNNQNETPRDIAKRKNFIEIVGIIDSQSDKIDKKLIRESLRKSKNGGHESLPHNKQKYNDNFISPYGCHYYPNSRNFPHPKLQTLPKEPLQKGEVYYLDLAGNIRKGPIGMSKNCACNCGQSSKEAMVEHCHNIQKYVDRANEKLNRKIIQLTTKIEKTERKHHQRERSRERDLDPLYPLLKIVGDKNKQIHLEKWLNKVHPDADESPSEVRSSEIMAIQQVPVDVHCADTQRNKPREAIKVSRNSSRRMPEYDENEQRTHELENEDSYTDITDNEGDDDDEEEDNEASVSDSENPLYDESFIRKFQQQQYAQQNCYQNESLTSQSINSNQNIEMEMEKIAKSLMTTNGEEAVLINSRNPDVIKDIHVSHSAKRSTKKVKSAITKPTSTISSGNLYVNTFFNNDSSDGNRNRYKNSHSDADEVDSCEIEQLVTKVQQTFAGLGSNYTSSSSPRQQQQQHSHPSYYQQQHSHENQTFWNRVGARSRNPIPIDLTDEIDNYADALFHDPTTLEIEEMTDERQVQLLDKLLKARKQLNQNYHQTMSGNSVDENGNSSNIPSSSLV